MDSRTGFVIKKPNGSNWTIENHKRFGELLVEKGLSRSIIDEYLSQNLVTDADKNIYPVILRNGERQEVRYTQETIINEEQVDYEGILEAFQGGKEQIYDYIAILPIRKDACKAKLTLIDVFAGELSIARHLGPRTLRTNDDNTVFLIDCSAIFSNIEYNGKLGTHAINNAFLFQENAQFFFEVILAYVQASHKPPSVWEELRELLASFRILPDPWDSD